MVAPLVIEMAGMQGFWPILAVFMAVILWTLFLFWDELSRLRVISGPEDTLQGERPFRLILPGIAMFLLALYPFVHLYQAAVRHIEPLTFNDLLQTYIHDRRLYITDLARTERVVRGKVFENVTFVGPAIVSFNGASDLRDTAFDAEGAPEEALLLEVLRGTLTVGAILFEDCIFRNCLFIRIQVMGTKEVIEEIKRNTVRRYR